METPIEDQRFRVLVVDDDPGIMHLLTSALADDERLVLSVATDGEQALKRCREVRPHLVLLDVMLPGRAGYAVCRLVKHDPELGGTRIVMMTALAHHRTLETWRKVGADDFLAKPFLVRDLLDKVEKHLPRKREAA